MFFISLAHHSKISFIKSKGSKILVKNPTIILTLGVRVWEFSFWYKRDKEEAAKKRGGGRRLMFDRKEREQRGLELVMAMRRKRNSGKERQPEGGGG